MARFWAAEQKSRSCLCLPPPRARVSVRDVKPAAAIVAAAIALAALAVEPALAATPKPTLARTVVVKRAGGTVTVKRPRGRKFKLTKATAIPVGSTIDTTRGTVLLVSAADAHTTQSGRFSQGAFVVTQQRDGLTDLQLTGGDFSKCPGGNPQGRVLAAATSRKRRLFGNAHGRFRTRGRHSSATVRGTVWSVEDRCDGTVTSDMRGTVDTTSRKLNETLQPGQTVHYYCNHDAIKPDTYCVVLLSKPAEGLAGAGIITQQDATQYALCYGAPDGQAGCFQFPLSPPDAQGFHESAVVCGVGQIGTFGFSWVVKGVFLFPSLSETFTVVSKNGCVHQP